ncbi:Sec1p [Malassezia vespertilionis]|uniref:Sec1p n=2 Tax=Malassezia vespertilionis TaxID=2020962 RepID=A0A2N1JD12_9BASI|nr:Sec1p [Malassezia vespertilionis]
MSAKSLQTLVKNRYIHAIQSVQPPTRWKHLVVDSHTMAYLNCVMRMFDILDQNVAQVENIEKRRDPKPDYEAMYLLTSTSQNVDRVIEELAPSASGKQPQFGAGHVFFVDSISDALVEKLTSSAAGPKLRQLVELFVAMWPMEAQTFLLKQPHSLFHLFQPMSTPYSPSMEESLALVQEELDLAAQALLNVCITLNENPHIRYLNPSGEPLGPLSLAAQHDTVEGATVPPPKQECGGLDAIRVGEHFTKQLAFRVQALLDDYAKTGQLLGEPNRPQGVLLITDRTMDTVAPYLHEFTYQAMVNDLLKLEEGTRYKHTYTNAEGEREEVVAELSDEDDIFTAIRHLHIAEAIAHLTNEFQQHMGEAATFSNAGSISGMRDMLASLPHMQSTKEKLSLHLSLAQQCMDRFEKSKLAAQAMVEQNSATGRDPSGAKPRALVEEMVPLLGDAQISNADKVRIIALYILFCEGVHDEDRKRLFQHARLSSSEVGAVNNLVHLGVRTVRDTSGSGFDAIFKRRKRELKPMGPLKGEGEYELSRYQPLIRTMIEEHSMGRLDQSYFPYVKDAPPETAALGSLSRTTSPSISSFSSSASGMATSMLNSAINATGGKDSPFARVGRFDASSTARPSPSGSASLRSAKPTWHQKSRASSVASINTAGGALATSRGPISPETSNPTAQRVIVFMAGGMTYSEIRTAYQVGRRMNTDVYIGSSHIHTPASFMDELRVLGTARQPAPNSPHIQARREAEAAFQRQKAMVEQDKKFKPKVIEPPAYTHMLPPQKRYDLRYATVSEPEPEPEKEKASGKERIAGAFNSFRGQGPDLNAKPQPAAPAPEERVKRRDLSKFK